MLVGGIFPLFVKSQSCSCSKTALRKYKDDISPIYFAKVLQSVRTKWLFKESDIEVQKIIQKYQPGLAVERGAKAIIHSRKSSFKT